MILEKETALFQKDKISDEIIAAKQTADKYITAIDQSGIKVHAENSPDINYSKINGEGLEVFKGTTVNNSTSVAKFGDIARVGAEDSQRTVLRPDGYYIYDSDNIPQFSVRAQGTTRTGIVPVEIPNGNYPYGIETEVPIASGSTFTYRINARGVTFVSGTATATVGTVTNGNYGTLKITSTDSTKTVFTYAYNGLGYCDVKYTTTYDVPLIETVGDCDIEGLVTASNIHEILTAAIKADSSSIVQLTTSYQKMILTKAAIIGDNLWVMGGGIACFKDGNVLVSGQAQFYGVTDGHVCNVQIWKNTTSVAMTSARCRGDRTMLVVSPRLISVSANDVLYLYVANTSGATGQAGSTTSTVGDAERTRNYLTVQYV